MKTMTALQGGLATIAMVFGVSGLAIAQEAETEQAAQQQEIDAMEPAVSTQDPPAEAPAPAIRRRESASGVIDELDLSRTTITGNQELPKVLYIVPWKQADLGDLVGRPVNTLLDEALEPVDRDVFKRQIGYYNDLYGLDSAGSANEP